MVPNRRVAIDVDAPCDLDHWVLPFRHSVTRCFEDFVKYVIPELQRRGIYRKDYTGPTLRDHLGLNRPDIGAWKTNLD